MAKEKAKAIGEKVKEVCSVDSRSKECLELKGKWNRACAKEK